MSDNPLSTENRASIVERAKGIIMAPAAEWPKVAAETKSPTEVLLQYALPLMLIAPICTILGSFLAPAGPFNFGLSFYVSTAIVGFVLGIAMLYALAFIANFLSPKFAGKDDFAAAFRLCAYSQTPSWLLGALGLVTGFAPMLGILGLLALYGLYLFYLGATPVMNVPQDKAVGYTAVTIVCAIVLNFIIAAITTAIVAAMIVTPAMTVVTYS